MKRFSKNVFALVGIVVSGFFLVQDAYGQDKTINVNLYASNNSYNNTAWNNQLITQPSYPFTSGTYNYSDGTASAVYTTISASQGPTSSTYADNGAGYATTMCPSAVGRYASYLSAARTVTFKGLNNSKLYTIQLYCSRATSQGTTRNTINGVNADISVYNNFTSIATFSNIVPSGGQIVLTQTPLNVYVYLNGFTITEKTTAGNQAPTANAGSNQSITLPTNQVTLNGSGTDPDGTIAAYAWSQISGTSATIASSSSGSTNITDLTTAGTRVFRLTVTDNLGATGTSDVTIAVNSVSNQSPTANAGSNQTITLPASQVTLNGSGTDPDGTIASYTWSQISGTAATIVNPSSASANITGLTTAGARAFRLTVADNLGAIAISDVTVIVNAGGASPVVTTNNPQTISTATASLTSSVSSGAGIASIKWTKFSVPGQTIKTITVIGSSTAAGNGVTSADSAFVKRLQNYYAAQGIITTINNLAVAGTSPFEGNITTALNYNTDILVVSYPSNGYTASTNASVLARLQMFKDSTEARGKQFYITGTQPRNDFSVADRANLVVLNDSLRNRFGARFIDVLTPLLNTADNTMKAEYYYDGIHPNNAGHRIIFDKVRAINIFQNTISSASVITSPTSTSTDITSLINGVHQFQVSVVDNAGYAASSVAKITVSTPSNELPVANAGTDQTIILPASSVLLSGAASTDDHAIVSYQWTKLTGAGGTLTTATAATTTFTGLSQGVYTVELRVTDDSSAISRDTVKITVNFPPNTPPSARAGADQTIAVPTNSVSLDGTTSTDDHAIVSYQWTKLTGSGGTLTTPTASTTTFTNLSAGVYTVELRVTDDSSAVTKDTVQVTVNGASILNPADPVITYNEASPPSQPQTGQIGKWVRKVRMTWNTDSWKPYILNSLAFRLKYPKTYNPTANDGKKYPLIVFMHGLGETGMSGVNYDNEFSLANGGPVFTSAVDNGTFDGYVLVAQAPPGGWASSHFSTMVQIIDYMIVNNKLDRFQVILNGLSNGGQPCWEVTNFKPSYIAARLPMSASNLGIIADTGKLKFTPIWHFQGGLDNNPPPYITAQIKAAYDLAGSNFLKNTVYPDLGHGTWSTAWAEPDFFPYINRAYSSNPWPLFGRTEFCPGDPINVAIGVNEGFDGYQWRKDSVVIAGATANTIQAVQAGKYDARVLKGSLWSEWSRIPVIIKIKAPTVTPPITVSGMMSKVIPALDTNKVTLKVPSGYVSYTWQKTGSSTTISTDSTLSVVTPGDYIVKVTELYGCSSNFSTPFTVIDANGPNKPDAPANVSVSTVSKTSLRLDWSQNPAPQYNETNFEIYQSMQTGGPYKLVAVTGADVSSYSVAGLSFPGTKYYYKLRAVNNTGASIASNEATGSTDADIQPPSAPVSLIVVGTTRNAVSLAWGAATDDVTVIAYDVYVDGIKSYTTTQLQFTVNSLNYGQSYNFTVRAKDFAGNVSVASNQVTGQPLLNGLNYKQYVFTGNWASMPDFNNLTPVATGNMPNVSITPRTQNDNFAFLWQGYISIPTTGTYYFRTNSDDGSKLYLGALEVVNSPYGYSATAIVNNDGVHGATDVTSAALTLAAGVYPIAITFYDQNNSESITVSWMTPSTGSSFVTIPNSAFTDAAVVNGSAPVAPSNLTAAAVSYKRINLGWTDNSNNESGFEIWRSTNASTGFITIGVAAANTTNYADSNLTASTIYYYKVRAIGQYGESAYATTATATTAALPALSAAPGTLLATAAGSSVVNVSWSQPVQPPTADAGSPQIITLPSSQVTLTGSGTANNGGTITAYAWTQVSGAAATITTPSSTGTTVTGMTTSGIRVFRLTVTDNAGVTGTNDVTITVNGTGSSIAYGGIRRAIPGKLEAEDYDSGGQNIAYYDGTASNTGTLYRPAESVDIGTCGDTGGGYSIGWITDGEWVKYSVKVATTGLYSFTARITTPNTGRSIQFQIDGSTMGTLTLPNTGNWATWQTATLSNLPLTAGDHTFRFLFNTGDATNTNMGFDINWFNFSLLSATPTPTTVGAISKYELYRSVSNNTNYLLLASLPVNAISFTDSSLFANAIYYYKVRAINAAGPSVFGNEDSALTANHLPVITDIGNKTARYGITTELPVTATDEDAGTLSFSIQNKPAFATLTDNGNRTAAISLNPAVTDQGIYNNIRIIISDANGGSDTTVFSLTVNDNYNPAIDSLANYTIIENDSLNIPLTATDQNSADVLTWSVSNLPNAFTLTPGANGAAILQLKPNYAAAGVYTVQVSVSDGRGGTASRQFIVTVNDKDPTTKIYTRVKHSNTMGAPWNNIIGINTSNLKDEFNNTTSVGLNFQQSWWLPYNAGPTTGNNSGVYPDGVLNDFWYFGYYGGPQTAAVAVTGLNPAKKYNLTLYAGSVFNGVADNGTTTYTVGAKTVSLNVQNNTQNTVSINSITPAADGSIMVNMAKGANTSIGYLNALVITALYDDGTAPAAPKTLTAQNISGQGIRLSWQDAAYNETNYEIYRSLTAGGSYTLIGSVQSDAVTYTDGTVSGATQYYYKIRAVNSYGISGYSNITSATTANRVPQISVITDVVVMSNQTATVNVTATDDITDHITLTASGLPSFAAFVDNGNGTGVINIVPSASSLGTYSGITITAKDNSDSSRSTSFSIYVVDANITSTYVNISDYNNLAPSPWNNMAISYLPYAGTAAGNLTDDRNTNTGISVTLTDAWQAVSATGMRRRNGSELYPESVSRAGIYFTDNNTHRITVSGLNPAKKYNFVFYSSHSTSESALTNFNISSQTVSLNGCHNSNKTVQINGIVPAANGQVTINVTKNASAVTALLSALVIQSYTPGAVATYSPADLRVLDYAASNTVSLQWQDRADNETAYEVWRANDGGTYSLIATLAANTTSYNNTGLPANTTYNYIVRAKNGTTYSSYSNAVKGYTYATTVFVNVNTNNVAASPWNNLNWTYGVGAMWNNFKNEGGVPTNIGMVQPVKIDGMVSPGVNTGNNSGIFPDNVLAESFGLFPGLNSYIKLTGLNLSKVYDITLTASITGVYWDNTTAYTINGKTYLLNSIQNKDGLLTVFNIVPDQNGEVTINFTTYGGATYALLGALVIKGHDISTVASPVIPAGAVNSSLRVLTQEIQDQPQVTAGQETSVITAYPNPFNQYLTLSVPVSEKDNIRVQISDIAGKLIYEKQYDNLVKGNNLIRIEPGNSAVVPPGMYFVRIFYTKKGEQKTIKIIKQR